MIICIHEYYSIASCVSTDFKILSFKINKQINNRFRDMTRNGTLNDSYIKKKYGKSQAMKIFYMTILLCQLVILEWFFQKLKIEE